MGKRVCDGCYRTREGTQYLASVAVVWTEVIKLLVCAVAQMAECAGTAGQRGLPFRAELLHQAEEILGRSWPMLVPAALFVMQQARIIFPCALVSSTCTPVFLCLPLGGIPAQAGRQASLGISVIRAFQELACMVPSQDIWPTETRALELAYGTK